MSVRADFHVHTAFCDGAATPREMAEAARTAGLTALGFPGIRLWNSTLLQA